MSDRIYLAERQSHLSDKAVQAASVTARIAELSKYRCAVFFDMSSEDIDPRSRISVSVGGVPQRRPAMVLRLPLDTLNLRFVVLLEAGEDPIHHKDITIHSGTRLVAKIDASALQSPVVDQLSLLSSLSTDGQTKLLQALLTTGPSLFKSGTKTDKPLEGFDKLIEQLLTSLSVPSLPVESFRALGTHARALSYRVPGKADVIKINELVEVAGGRVKRIPAFKVVTHTDAKHSNLHIILSQPLTPDAILIGLSDRPIRLIGPAKDEELRPLQPWLGRQPSLIQRQMIDHLRTLRDADPLSKDLYNEVQCADRDQPKLSVLYAARCGDGLLYVLKTQDPRGLLSKARWVCDGVEIDVPLEQPVWHPVHGDIYVGFVCGFQFADQLPKEFHLWGEMRSRRAFFAKITTAQEFDGRIGDIYDPLENPAVDQMLGRAVATALCDRPAPEVTIDRFGICPKEPETALLIFVQDSFDYPRALLTQLAQELGADKSVAFLVAAHPSQRPGLRRLAEDLSAVTACAVAVLCCEAEALPSERLRAALAHQSAEATFIFDTACLPKRRGWLRRWHAFVQTSPDCQTAFIPADTRRSTDVPLSGCRIFNHTAVDRFNQLPLRSASIEADLSRLDGMTHAAVSETEGAICYDPGSKMSKIQSRADAEAIAYPGQRAL